MADPLAGRVAVVGAGWAGLACAVELADAGIPVDVFEASRTLGGRARTVRLDDLDVDNGAHILVGAYRETLRLMRKVGAGEAALERVPLHLEFPGVFRLSAPALPLPAPLALGWALATAQGLSWPEKLAAIRFLHALKKTRFRLPRDFPVSRLIANQPPALRRFLWGPLCVAALNTPVAEASAQVFLNVLHDTLAASRGAADLLLPTLDLTRLFPEPAARFVAAHGGEIHRATRIDNLARLSGYGYRVLAVAPWHLSKLAPEIRLPPLVWQPIATIYLRYPETVRLAFPMLGLINGHGQWVFDRGQLTGEKGLLAVVISGAGPWQALDHVQLGWAVHRQLAPLLPPLTLPRKMRVIEEKRATFACTPGLARPPAASGDPRLWLAGDYLASDYPATLEGAVRSGVATARAILAHRRSARQ